MKSKFTHILFSMLVMLAVCTYFESHASSLDNPDTRECIIDVSHDLVGVVEITHNSSPEIDAMLSLVEFAPGAAWCGADVAYTYAQCIDVEILDNYLPMKKWAYTPYTYSKAKESGTILFQSGKLTSLKQPKPGDQFWIYSAAKGRVVHTGIIDVWHPVGRKVITLEGNTNLFGSSEGDGHHVIYRDKRQLYAVANVLSSLS